MKRFVVLFLLAVLPIQITWAAGVVRCPHAGGESAVASADGEASHAAHSHAHAHDGDGGEHGHVAGSGFDCSLFHFVALEPLEAPGPSLSQARTSAFDADDPRYKSHSPGGLDRPKWRLAA